MAEYWVARKLEDVRSRMKKVDAYPAGSNWRERARKARTMQLLRDEEAKYRRLLPPVPEDDGENPF